MEVIANIDIGDDHAVAALLLRGKFLDDFLPEPRTVDLLGTDRGHRDAGHDDFGHGPI